MPATRTARGGLLVLAMLGVLALAPAAAQAAIGAQTDPQAPAELTVGQTGVPASIVLTNNNSDGEASQANQVCNVGSMPPCDGINGITLVPACAALGEPGCDVPDPGVFDVSATATGATGTACAGVTFTVTDSSTQPGAVVFTPVPLNEIILSPPAGATPTCKIDFTLDVIGMPIGTPPPGGGLPTSLYAEATQYTFFSSMFFTATGSGSAAVTVKQAQPTIATTASGDVVAGAGTLTDTATVSGRKSPDSNATVEFKLYGPGDTTCSAAPVFESGILLTDAANTVTSPPFVPTRAGTYRWIARYNGDTNNAAVSGACNDPGESVTVTAAGAPPRAPTTVALAASPKIVLGGLVFATATVGARVNPVPGAVVVFRLFGPGDTGCLGPPAFSAAAPVNGAGVAVSSPFTPPSLGDGTYRWIASYSGDANNLPSATACNAPGSTVVVEPLPARVLSASFVSPPRVGEPTFLVIGAYDPRRPIAGVEVNFGEPGGRTGISACRLSGFGVTESPMRLSMPFTFVEPGKHTITIVISSGDCKTKPTETRMTIEVDVAGGQSTRTAFAAAGARSRAAQDARAAQSGGCKNKFLAPTADTGRRLKVATAILCLVNAERAKKKLKKLKRSRVLAEAATGHSKDMLKRRYFDHVGPGGPSFQSRLKKVRYRGTAAAENIAYGSKFNAKRVVQAWMNSPPHKANILGPRLRFLGVGIAVGIPVTPGRPGSTYTQAFGSTVK